jgi:hypothetical protein
VYHNTDYVIDLIYIFYIIYFLCIIISLQSKVSDLRVFTTSQPLGLTPVSLILNVIVHFNVFLISKSHHLAISQPHTSFKFYNYVVIHFNVDPLLSHSLTTPQPHDPTASRPHSLTASQPHTSFKYYNSCAPQKKRSTKTGQLILKNFRHFLYQKEPFPNKAIFGAVKHKYTHRIQTTRLWENHNIDYVEVCGFAGCIL